MLENVFNGMVSMASTSSATETTTGNRGACPEVSGVEGTTKGRN